MNTSEKREVADYVLAGIYLVGHFIVAPIVIVALIAKAIKR